MKIGVFGDSHIPDRANEIPEKIKTELYNCDFIICTGDLTGEDVIDFIKDSGKDFKIVRGNMDHLNLQRVEQVKLEGKNIVVTHSDNIHPRGDKSQLVEIAKRYEADLLAYGHTHHQELWKKDGIIFLNPGSSTGQGADGESHCAVVEIKNNSINVREI